MRTLTVFALLAIAPMAVADDKELKGAFTKKAGDFDLTFEFKKDGIVVFKMTNGTDGCEMESKYTRDKDGVIKAEVTSFEKKGNFGVEKDKGYKFAFKAKINNKKLEISDLEGDDIGEEAKQLVHGEYEAVVQ